METWLELGAAGALFAASLLVGLTLTWLWPRGLQHLLEIFARGLGFIDKLLVERVTWLFGLHWVEGRFARAGRWSLLIAMFVALAFAGAFAPLLFALAALLLGVIGVIAAVRRWGWDEEDRANDVPKHLRRLQGDEDLVHEAMFTIAFMFLVAPILFYRLDQAFVLFDKPEALGAWAYAAYTLGEFLKAVPLMDYSEVYSVQNISGVTPTGLGGRHATFVFRMLMDLALIAAVLQLLSVMERIASGRDLRRLQDMLDGDDPDEAQSAITRLGEVGLRNQINAQRALVAVLDQTDRYPPELRVEAADALQTIGETLLDTPLLLTAISGYRALLRDWTRESNPEAWARTQNKLGTALQTLGERGDEDALHEAIGAFRLALEVRTRDAAPTQWAATQNNLGAVLAMLGARDEGALREAIAAFRSALEVRTRDAAPAQWAGTQNNLGNALQMLGARGDEAALRQAIAAYRLALEVRTRDAAPAQWALTQNNLGNALTTLGERGDEDALREAVAAYSLALELTTRDVAPARLAMTQNNLGAALQTLGARGDEAALRQAIAAHRLALEVHTRDAAPADWAATQNNLGNALQTLGARGDEAALKDAIAAYRLALEVNTREAAPADWARTQNNLGNALDVRGDRNSDKADWRAAADCFRAALEIWTPETYPPYHETASRSLARVLSRLDEP